MSEPRALYLEDFISLSRAEGYELMRNLNDSRKMFVIAAFKAGYRQCNLNACRPHMDTGELVRETAHRLEQFGIEMTVDETATHLANLFSACVRDEYEAEGA